MHAHTHTRICRSHQMDALFAIEFDVSDSEMADLSMKYTKYAREKKGRELYNCKQGLWESGNTTCRKRIAWTWRFFCLSFDTFIQSSRICLTSNASLFRLPIVHCSQSVRRYNVVKITMNWFIGMTQWANSSGPIHWLNFTWNNWYETLFLGHISIARFDFPAQETNFASHFRLPLNIRVCSCACTICFVSSHNWYSFVFT